MSALAVPGRGRPLRFLAMVALGWIVLRLILLWPAGGDLADAVRATFPLPVTARSETAPVPAQPMPRPAAQTHMAGLPHPAPDRAAVPPPGSPSTFALLGLISFGPAEPHEAMPAPPPSDRPVTLARIPAPPALLARSESGDLWQASAWLVTRRGAGPGGAMLGGDQAGVRLARSLDRHGRLLAYARASAALGATGREVALGVEWRPWRAPLRFMAEQRVALDGGRSGPALGLVTGVDRVDLPFHFALEAYGQAGMVLRDDLSGYADGAVRVTRDVARTGAVRIALGAGAWGAVQQDAARFDVGPSAVTTLPVAGGTWRLALDWRARVAGDARPGSGPALSLGADF